MDNILVIGTSHTVDKGYVLYPDKKYYCNYQDGELRWTEYLASKLNMNLIDMAVPGYGIETYAPRILSVEDNYSVALIEMPSNHRHELYVEQKNENYKRNYLFNIEFWAEIENRKSKSFSMDEVVRYNGGDDILNDTTKNKLERVNNGAEIPLPVEDFEASIRNIVRHNQFLLDDKIYATMVMINGYFKSKKVLPIWFNYDFGYRDVTDDKKAEAGNYDFTDFIMVNSQIGFRELLGYVQDNMGYLIKNDVNYCADGTHLNSIHWRTLVDELFVKFINKRRI